MKLIIMVGFSGVLDTVDAEMLVVNLMIIQFRLRLDKFYCIGL